MSKVDMSFKKQSAPKGVRIGQSIRDTRAAAFLRALMGQYGVRGLNYTGSKEIRATTLELEDGIGYEGTIMYPRRKGDEANRYLAGVGDNWLSIDSVGGNDQRGMDDTYISRGMGNTSFIFHGPAYDQFVLGNFSHPNLGPSGPSIAALRSDGYKLFPIAASTARIPTLHVKPTARKLEIRNLDTERVATFDVGIYYRKPREKPEKLVIEL